MNRKGDTQMQNNFYTLNYNQIMKMRIIKNIIKDNKNDLSDYKFSEYETIIFAKTSNNENLYIFDTDKHSLLSGIGWKPVKINNKMFIVNDSKESTSGGIYTLDYDLNNVIVNITNIDSGKWKLNKSDDYIFALSILGTNRGIKITDKTNILFKLS